MKRIIRYSALILVTIAIFSYFFGRFLYQGRPPDLGSFAVVHFLGYLFFLLMPVEAAFVYAVHGNDPLAMIILAISTALLAQGFDYGIGKMLSDTVIKNIIGQKRFKRAEGYLDTYGNATIFAFNLLPLSSPIIVLAAGMLDRKVQSVFLYSFLGLSIKYIILTAVFI